MITLKELVDLQKFNHADDIALIRTWFCENDKESEGIELITELSKSKIEKMDRQLTYIKTWLPNVPSVWSSNNKLSGDDVDRLNRIIRYHIIGSDLPQSLLDWAKENIPNMNIPDIIFIPMVEWLKHRYQIEFRNYPVN